MNKRPVVSHTRSTQGGGSRPLRLQRIRRPVGKKEENNMAVGKQQKPQCSTRSMVFHQAGQDMEDDMSDFQYSVAHGLGKDASDRDLTENVNPACSGELSMDCETVGDESLYTTCIKPKEEPDPCQVDRKQKMALAGVENSIPTCIFGEGQNVSCYGTSKLSLGYGISGRSLVSVGEDPTEEESFNQDSSQEHYNQHDHAPVQVRTIQEESCHSETHSSEQQQQLQAGVLVPKKKKKQNFLRKLWTKIFTTSTSKQKNHKMRHSTPMQRSPTELWNSIPTPPKGRTTTTTTNINSHTPHPHHIPHTRRARAQSVPVKVAPKDLWAPEQAKERGIPGANLRVSTAGERLWENASGRLIPFDAAEC